MDKINTVNAGIQVVSQDANCEYKDCSSFLKLANGSINDDYYIRDCIHLNNKGQDKLCSALSITKKQDVDSYCYLLRKSLNSTSRNQASSQDNVVNNNWQTVTRKRSHVTTSHVKQHSNSRMFDKRGKTEHQTTRGTSRHTHDNTTAVKPTIGYKTVAMPNH